MSVDKLTERELEVLLVLCSGRSMSEIGEVLSIARNTVKTHLDVIKDKLQVNSLTRAVVKAIQGNLVNYRTREKPFFCGDMVEVKPFNSISRYFITGQVIEIRESIGRTEYLVEFQLAEKERSLRLLLSSNELILYNSNVSMLEQLMKREQEER